MDRIRYLKLCAALEGTTSLPALCFLETVPELLGLLRKFCLGIE